jgi:hypothetical protein
VRARRAQHLHGAVSCPLEVTTQVVAVGLGGPPAVAGEERHGGELRLIELEGCLGLLNDRRCHSIVVTADFLVMGDPGNRESSAGVRWQVCEALFTAPLGAAVSQADNDQSDTGGSEFCVLGRSDGRKSAR